MAGGKKQNKTISVREILRQLGDAFDTDRIYHLVYDLFDSMNGGGCSPEKLFGKGYLSFTNVPATKKSRQLVKNLVMLRAMGMAPREIIKLLKDSTGFETDGASAVLKRVFKDSLGFYRVQHEVSGWMIQRADSLYELIGEKGLKTLLFTDLFSGAGGPVAQPTTASDVPATPLSPITALVNLDQLSEQEGHAGDSASPDARAQYACHLFELGSYREAQRVVAEILKTDPWHGMANYVGAMLHHAESVVRNWTAQQKAFIAEVTSMDGEGFVSDAHEEEALQLQGEAAYHQQQSLVQYLIALKHWPQHRHYFDHSRRRAEVLRAAVVMLAQRARARDSQSGLALQALLPSTVQGTPALPDLDAIVLEVLRSAEPDRYSGDFGSRPYDGLCWLDVYRVLNAKEYERFAREWLARLERSYSTEELEAVTRHPAFLEHLRRILPTPDARRTFLRTLEHRCQKMVAYTWSSTTCEMLTVDMCECYRQGRLDEAESIARERAAMRSDHQRAATYEHVRVLYDLSQMAWEKEDPAASARWLCRIVETYPRLLDIFTRSDIKDYLTLIDEDFYKYQDSFGNEQDIILGDEDGEDAPFEDAPLGRHVLRLLDSDRVADAEKAALRLLLSRGGDQ